MSISEEWKRLVRSLDKFYIFGKGEVGRRLYDLVCYEGMQDKFIGFVDSGTFALSDMIGEDATVLVSVTKLYHPEVYDLLERYSCNIVECHKFYNLSMQNQDTVLVNDNSDGETIVGEDIKAMISERYKKIGAAFGSSEFYQSFPRLGMDGVRSTEERIKKYGLYNLLDKEKSVLDIGSNCGFLDMEIAGHAKVIDALEYDEVMMDFSAYCSSLLGIGNINNICGDFCEWSVATKNRYSIILALAVHVWIDLKPDEFAKRIDKLLEHGGNLVFESHNIKTDTRYKDFCNGFRQLGYTVNKSGNIIDDGKQMRKYCIFGKE